MGRSAVVSLTTQGQQVCVCVLRQGGWVCLRTRELCMTDSWTMGATRKSFSEGISPIRGSGAGNGLVLGLAGSFRSLLPGLRGKRRKKWPRVPDGAALAAV